MDKGYIHLLDIPFSYIIYYQQTAYLHTWTHVYVHATYVHGDIRAHPATDARARKRRPSMVCKILPLRWLGAQTNLAPSPTILTLAESKLRMNTDLPQMHQHPDEGLVEECAVRFGRKLKPAQPVYMIASHIDVARPDCTWLFVPESNLSTLLLRDIQLDMRTKRLVPLEGGSHV